jgi:cytoskeletal protein RodZ
MSKQEDKSEIWKIYYILMGLMLAGSALVLGGQTAWNKWQEHSELNLHNTESMRTPVSTVSKNSSDSTKSISSPTPTSVQLSVQTEQVNFELGTSGASLRGNVSVGQVRRYLLNCGAGQTMKVNFIQGSIRAVIKSPDNRSLGEITESSNQWQGRLPRDGDYQVEVSSSSGSDYFVTIEVL